MGGPLGAAPARAEPATSLTLLGAEPTPSGAGMSEEEWAAQLVHELGLSAPLRGDASTEELFSLLCVEKAERVLGSGGRQLPADGEFRVSVAAPRRRSPHGPVRIVVTLPATALYQLRVEGVGPQRWVIDQEPVGHLDPSPLGVAQAAALVALRKGPHEITGYLTPQARVERVELAAHRTLCAAPAEGWRQGRPLRQGALARTLVRAFGLERRLPERADERVRIEGERFESASGEGGLSERRLETPASGGAWAAAVSGPTEFTWLVELEKPRVVSFEARTHGALPQIWSVDGRYRVRVVPESVEAGFAWSPIVTLSLSSGRHALRALVARGSGIDVLRVVPHRSRDADYIAVLEGLGLPGRAPESSVPRSEAQRVLASPIFGELAAAFRARLSGGAADRTVVLVDDEPEPFVSRTLSPALPAEL